MRGDLRRAFPEFPALSNTAYSLGWLVGRSSLVARGSVSSSGPKISFAKEIEMNLSSVARALRVGALIMTFGLLATGASAQQQPAPKGPPPSAAQVQIAREIIEASGASHAFDAALPQMMQEAYSSFLQQNPDLQKPLFESINAISGDFAKRQTEILDLMAQSYASHFSEAEMKELLAFYRSPT